MSYLSASENVGFSGIPQTISDASCASQYKMAVEGVSGNCSEVMYIQDNIGDEQPFITHLNDNFYTKFKIDPNELYTFHDSDIIAGEITVSHTEDAFIFPESVDTKSKTLECPSKELDTLGALTNGDVKHEVQKKVITNGHHTSDPKPVPTLNHKDSKTTHTKVPKAKNQNQVKEPVQTDSSNEVRRLSVHSPKGQSIATSPSPCNRTSINSVNTSNVKLTPASKQAGGETFLDVFKREQGLVENSTVVKDDLPAPPIIKIPTTPPKKVAAGKPPSQARVRRGRGPALHEALQRISSTQRRVVPVPNSSWHAPGDNLFDCGPLDNKKTAFRQLESSSSDDDNMPDFVSGRGPVCVEESAAESRGSRLALRRAALRRHVARAHAALSLARGQRDKRALASVIKKQLNGQSSSGHLPTQTVNHLLALRGMPAVLNTRERRRLRENGWSGGESGLNGPGGACTEEKCTQPSMPCAHYCFSHITLAAEQRLYASCAAVFAGGARCKQPLLPLQDQTPLCAEHAWKRDNYDKLSRDSKPKKVVRGRVPPAPRRAKRRRRPPAPARPRPSAPPPPPAADHSLSEMNVGSNSSTYDSSEDTAMGALSENEYITVASNSHGLEVEVGQVPPDDILDPTVLSQIPDEAFTEFFNQAEGGAPFAESAELAAALEAVLDERVLDERALDTIADCVFTHSPHAHVVKNKMQVQASVPMEMSSGASS